MGNLKSGNSDSSYLPQISGLLDALYKNNTIDKKLYKILWYNIKSRT